MSPPRHFTLSLTAEIGAGSSIEHAAEDAQELADKLGVFVRFKFNEVSCTARPTGSVEKLVAEWRKATDLKDPPYGLRMAFS